MPKVLRARSPDTGSPSSTIISPRDQKPQSLPSPLSSTVPTCARSCLASSLASQYDSNCVSSGLSCVCSNYSSQGYALGELALGCAYSACSGASQQTEIDSYNLCSAVRNAVLPTHTVLTLAPTPTSTASTSSQSFTSTTTSSTSSSSTSQSTTSSNNGSSTSSSQGPSSAGVSATTTTQPLVHSGLTSSQTGGVSVGCVGAVAIIVALIVWFVLRRKRKREEFSYVNEKDGFDFIDHTPAQIATSHFQGYGALKATNNHLLPGGLQGSYGYGAANSKATPSAANSTAGHDAPLNMSGARTIQKPPIARIGIGGAMSSQKASSPPLRESNESTRTVSQLLPDKPTPTPSQTRHGTHLHPMDSSQVRISPPMRTAATLFEQEHGKPQATQAPTRSNPPYAVPPPSKDQRRPVEEIRQPALSLQIPRQANRPTPQQMVHPPRTSSNQRFAASGGHGTRNSPGRDTGVPKTLPPKVDNMAQLRYYRVVNPDAPHNRPSTDQPSRADPDSATPIDEEEQRRRVVPAAIKVTKPIYPPQAVGKRNTERDAGTRSGRDSAGSNTSFESLEDELGTSKAVDDRQLSPVQEHSPISGIKYPRIPKSVHHSSGMYNSSPRQAAKDVPAPLSVGRSPLPAVTPPHQTGQEHWRNHHDAIKTQVIEAGPLSPLWGTKLTPSRRGDDLYLSVSLVSPR